MQSNTGRAVVLKAVADIAARAAGLITFPILAYYIGADGYGAFGQVNTIIGFVVPFASLGLGGAMVRSFAGRPWSRDIRGRMQRVTLTVTAASLVATGLVALLAPLLNSLFLGVPGGADLFRWGSLLILTGSLEVFFLDLMRSRGWLTQYALFQLGQAAVVTTATAIVLPAGGGLIELIQATAAVKAAAIVLNAGLLATKRANDATDDQPPPAIGPMLRFGLPYTVAGLGLFLMNFGDRLVIGGLMDPDDLGRYVAVFSLANVLLLASGPLFLPFYPQLMTAVRAGDEGAIDRTIGTYHRFVSLAVIPTAAFLIVIIGPALILMGGSEFDVGVLLVALVVLGIFLGQWNGLAHYVLYCYDRATLSQNLWIGFGVLNLALNVPAVALFGLEGSAAVTLLTFVGLEICMLRAADGLTPTWRRYQMRPAVEAAAASAVGAGVAVVALAAIGPDGVQVVVATAAFWVAYVVAGFAIGGITLSDVARLLQAVGLSRLSPRATGA